MDDTVDSDADPATGQTPTTTLDPNEVDLTIDMGIFEPARIGDYVWIDADGNGQQGDPVTEPPVEGVTVLLLDENGNQIELHVDRHRWALRVHRRSGYLHGGLRGAGRA